MTNFLEKNYVVFILANLSLFSCTMPSVSNDNTKFISCAQIVGIKDFNSRKNYFDDKSNEEQRGIKVRIISAESETVFVLRNTNESDLWIFYKIQNGIILQRDQFKSDDLAIKFDDLLVMEEESFIEDGKVSHISCMQIDLSYGDLLKRYSVSGVEKEKIPTNIKNLINILYIEKILYELR